MSGDLRSPGLSAMDGSSFSKFEAAIRRKAAVLAVEDGHMSENEAMRYLKMDAEGRMQSELSLPESYLHRAHDELREEWREWYGV